MEEDIKILVDLIFEIKKLGVDEEKAQAIENLINRVKELEENQIWSEATITGLKQDFIPKSKIREIRDKAEVMDYYTLGNVIDDLNKLLEDK